MKYYMSILIPLFALNIIFSYIWSLWLWEGLFQLCAGSLSMLICLKEAPKNPNIHFSLQNVIW